MILTYVWAAVAVAALLLYLWQTYTKLSRAGVNHLPFIPFLGHTAYVFFKMEHTLDGIMRVINAFPDDKIVGQYELVSPVYLVKDIEMLKKITTKDFDHFVDRRGFVDTTDPLFGRGLLLLKGDEWKAMRSTLSPAFTSSKIRLMVPLMMDVGDQMINGLKQRIQESGKNYIDVDGKDLATRYACDVIASCAFGLKVDSQMENNQFYNLSREITSSSSVGLIKVFLFRSFPGLAKLLHIKLSSSEASKFFRDIVLATMRDRDAHHTVRPDMINILIQVRKGQLSHEYKESANNNVGAGFATVEESAVGKKQYDIEWSDTDLVAQAALFLSAGFETVSTAMSFLLHELALNPDVQERLVEEIREHDINHGGKFDFNSIQNMTYLDMVVSEGLRLWPAAPLVARTCVKDYNAGRPNNTSPNDLIIRKGDDVALPIWAFHRNPEYFPEPEKFVPERFSEENRQNIKPFSYMPFGVGPRNCIGSRFALCELKVMLYQLLRDMEAYPCERTCYPTKLTKEGFGLRIQGGAWVRLRIRN